MIIRKKYVKKCANAQAQGTHAPTIAPPRLFSGVMYRSNISRESQTTTTTESSRKSLVSREERRKIKIPGINSSRQKVRPVRRQSSSSLSLHQKKSIVETQKRERTRKAPPPPAPAHDVRTVPVRRPPRPPSPVVETAIVVRTQQQQHG
jgi:hypothetical protein